MKEEYLTGEMVDLLREIRDEAKKTNARLETIEGEFGGFRREMREDLAAVQATVQAGQKEIVAELRGLRKEVGADLVQVKERLEKLEAAVFPKPRRPARPTGARR